MGTQNIANGAVTTTQIADGTITAADLATGIVLQLATTGTTRKVAFGSGTLAWPGGSQFATSLVVTHGLGTAPTQVILTNTANSGLGVYPVMNLQAKGATTFTVSACTSDGTSPLNTATSGFDWVALG